MTKTTWVKYPIGDQVSFVPRTTKILTERLSGVTVEIELTWDWIPHKKWEEVKPELNKLFVLDLKNFRQPFADLFEEK